MSETTASLRRKIGSAENLQSVVRTMKTLAASNIGQYESSVRALADYYRTVEQGLGTCLRGSEPTTSLAAANGRAEPGSIGAVVFGSDQGLVGRFNEVVVDHALETLSALPTDLKLWAVGERVRSHLTEAGLTLRGIFSVPSSVDAITSLVGRILVQSETHDSHSASSTLHLFYNRAESGAVYVPVNLRLLPLDEAWRRRLTDRPWPTTNLPEVLGDRTSAAGAIIREYLFVSLFRACAESLASENASRLAAMERADRNIDELLENLQGKFHRLRQSGIDAELFDVISGYEALSTRL